jgi:two-component system phosphate regulon sensor histidine kinase PhoR
VSAASRRQGALAAVLAIAGLALTWWAGSAHGGLAGWCAAGWSLAAGGAAVVAWRLRVRADQLAALCRAYADGRYGERADLPPGALSGLGRGLNHLGERLERAHVELARSRALLDSALGALGEGVACLDPLHNVVYANAAYGELAAAGAAVLGQPFYRHLPGADLDGPLARIKAGERDVGPIDLPHARRHLRARLIRAADDVVVLVLHDLSEVKRLELRRRDFMSAVSHELKTPLTAILGFTETILEDDAIAAPQMRVFVERIARQADRLAVLVRDVLTLSRLEEGAWHTHPEPIDLAALGRDVLDDFQGAASTARVALVLEAAGEVMLTADREAMRMLIGNLVSNAVRYNRSDGTVWLRLRAIDGGAEVVVADTGIGIPAEHRERIFERFYRVDSHRSRQTGGTGLGLSIVKHLLQLLGGGIELDSDSNGTRFAVRFTHQVARLPA